MQRNSSDYNSQKAKFIEMLDDNVNISKTSDGKEFLYLVSAILVILLGVYIFSDVISGIIVNNLSVKNRLAIEQIFKFQQQENEDKKYETELVQLNKIKNEIIRSDKSLQIKNDFPLHVINEREVNAAIAPDGSIFITSGLLKELKNEQTYAFILAHELGHYKHKDHLKSFGRQIIWHTITTILTGGNSSSGVGQITYSTGSLTELKYSKNQEYAADRYANRYIKLRYGSNKAAVDFFKYLDKKYDMPEFVHYLSTHPSPEQRIQKITQ
ncbi:M48 family metallopeptidase [bacterium]|nr:M48 family metallopeptidase [bacterium]